MKKVIGLIPLYDDEKKSYWMLPGYMKVLERCGALPIMLPLTNDKDELDDAYLLCDGILFTGGHDVDPSLYGEKATDKCGISNPMRDTMEAYLINKALSEDKPVFGICRGIQFFNAFLGGTLYQDIPSEFETRIEHHMEAPYDRTAHKVNVYPGTMLSGIIGEGVHEVNSYHHQAVKDISDKVTVAAESEDGLVEAIEVNGRRFAMAVQWHPEFSFENNEESLKVIKAFVDAC